MRSTRTYSCVTTKFPAKCSLLIVACLLAGPSGSGTAWGLSHHQPQPNFHKAIPDTSAADVEPNGAVSRRGVLELTALSGLFVLGVASSPDEASAFPNKISNKYDDRPRQRGSMPRELGVANRQDLGGEDYLGLKHCKGSPNCFCSTDSLEDDADHNIPSWVWPKAYGDDSDRAFAELSAVIDAYQPGQNNVDGGGFKVVTNDPKKRYIYAQFESLKNGYIDDFELAYIPSLGQERAFQVRSASRLGYLDFAVNAKRLNFIAAALRAKGWDAVGVEESTHQNYFILNQAT